MSPNDNMIEPTMKPPQSGITVRMYNPGFGDCFLLAFRTEDKKARYMLIDFGVHHQYPGREERAKLVAKDIAKSTGNHLHVVATTHEHTDHLYGFKYGSDIFEQDQFEIDELWLAWTENPTDPVAKELKDLYGMRIRALSEVVRQLRMTDKASSSKLDRVLNFEFTNALAATGGNAAQLEYLRTKSKKKLNTPADYRYPGEAPLTLPGVKGVKIYVLGPPRDVDMIKKLEKKSEMYPKLAALDRVAGFCAAALAGVGIDSLKEEDRHLIDLTCPFDKSKEISRNKAPGHPNFGSFFKEYYGFSDEAGHGSEWRRIETDWLGSAEELALSINRKTNNTSLVLAIELTQTDPHRVLLFAADAQVGNWLSWQELEWPGEGEGAETVKSDDLLKRTILYKVGHHGSRNATLSWKGLEKMESSDLVAMIPVDQDWANEEMGWEHPAEKLLERLEEKTKGRIIRSDIIPDGDQPPDKPDEATKSEWQAFIKQLDWDRGPNKLWIQYTVPG